MPAKTSGSDVLYDDGWYRIKRKPVRIKGRKFDFSVLIQKDAVVVVPLLDDGRLILERQLRHKIGKRIYEFPAGHIEKGERPVSAARRELDEETGYRARRIRHMFSAYASPGDGPRIFHYYLALVDRKGGRRLDGTEEITLHAIRPDTVERMIKGGRIVDHQTVSGYTYYKSFVKK